MEALRVWVARAVAWGAKAWETAIRVLSPLLRRGWALLSRAAKGLMRLMAWIGGGVRHLATRIDYRPFHGHGAVWRAPVYAVLMSAALLWVCAGWFNVDGIAMLFGRETRPALVRASVPLGEGIPWWVQGLAACGAVGVVYWLWHGLMGRRAARVGRDHRAAAWPDLWMIAAPLLIVGTLLLAQRSEETPSGTTLAGLILSLLIGVGLATAPGEAIALRPRALGWPLVEGALWAIPLAWGRLIMDALTDLEGMALAAAGDGGGLVLAAALVAGIGWLHRRAWRPRWPAPQASVTAGLCLAYLLTPLVLTALALAGVSSAPSFAVGSVGLRLVTSAGVVGLAVAESRWYSTNS